MEVKTRLDKLKVVFVSIFMVLSFELLFLSQNSVLALFDGMGLFQSAESKLLYLVLHQIFAYSLIFLLFRSYLSEDLFPEKERRMHGSIALYALLFALSYLISASTLSIFTYWVDIAPSESELLFQEIIDKYPWFGIVSALLVAPFFEEVFFRYFIYRYLKSALPPTRAMILSALLFGIFHMNLRQFLFTSVLGAILAMVYEKTGRLRDPIFMHFVFNLASFVGFVLLFKPLFILPITMAFLLLTLRFIR